MGLALCCKDESVHMSYSGFFRFREAIANVIGLPMHLMSGFLDTSNSKAQFIHNIHNIDADYRAGLSIRWSILKYDSLHNLINHSDYDGTLTWKVAGKIGKRLKEIQEEIKFETFGIHKEIYNQMIELCEYASKNRKHIDFY